MAAVLAEAEARRLPEQFQWWWLVARFLFPVVLRWRRRRPIIRGRAGRFRRLAWGHQRQFGSRISGDSTPPFRRSSFRLGRCCGRCRRRGLRWRWNRHPNGRIAPLLKRLTNGRSEEDTAVLHSLMRISFAVLCLKQTTKAR